MEEYITEAADILDKNIDESTGFLWTGGSEAQVIADILLSNDYDVTCLTVETDNQFESVTNFRGEFAATNEFDWKIRKNRDLLEKIHDDDDPRGYHGRWQSDVESYDGMSADEWTVERSCGALKVVPIKEFIQQDGFDTLITGVREDDPVAGAEFGPTVDRATPAPHTRVNPLHNWSESHVWAYLKFHFVEYPDIYDEGYRHTDTKCCTDNDVIGEHGEGGRDPQKLDRKEKLRDMGYV